MRLSPGHERPVFPDRSVESAALRQPGREPDPLQHRFERCVVRCVAGEEQVLTDVRVEQERSLFDEPDRLTERVRPDLAGLHTADAIPALVLEEADEHVSERGLPRAAVALDEEAIPRRQPEADRSEGGPCIAWPARAQVLDLEQDPVGDGQLGDAGVLVRDLRGAGARDRVRHSFSARDRLAPGAERERHHRTDLEHGERDEYDHRERGSADRAERRHTRPQRSDDGRTRGERQHGSGHPGSRRPPDHGPRQRSVRPLDPGASGADGTVRRQDVQAGDEVQERFRKCAAQWGEVTFGSRGHTTDQQPRHEERDDEAHRQGDPRCRKQRGRQDDRGARDDPRHHQRLDDAQRHVLQLVDVGHESCEEIASPGELQAVRSHGDDPFDHSGAQLRQLAEGRIVAEQSFEVPERRPREGERTDADDGDAEFDDRRLLGGLGDEERTGGEQGDGRSG